jgi:hypothetical protein
MAFAHGSLLRSFASLYGCASLHYDWFARAFASMKTVDAEEARQIQEGGMKLRAKVNQDKQTVTVSVPLQMRRRGGRKLVIAPDGGNVVMLPRSRVDSTIVKAIARAYGWREMLENGTHATIAEIAAAEKINESYVGRVLRLTMLAPDIGPAQL